MIQRLASLRPPYVPITVTVRQATRRYTALLDTGFDGDIIVPRSFASVAGTPNGYAAFILADGSSGQTEIFLGSVDLDPLGTFPADVLALGDECLMGRGLADRFKIILDHGRELVIEP